MNVSLNQLNPSQHKYFNMIFSRNIVLIVGDGMSLETITASRKFHKIIRGAIISPSKHKACLNSIVVLGFLFLIKST